MKEYEVAITTFTCYSGTSGEPIVKFSKDVATCLAYKPVSLFFFPKSRMVAFLMWGKRSIPWPFKLKVIF